MKTKSTRVMPWIALASHRARLARALALTLMATMVIVSVASCSRKADNNTQTPTVTANGVKPTDAQRKNIALHTVASSKYHKTIDTTGTVDFDNDQATSVIAPFSGPVTQLLVPLGQPVKKGEALAMVDSADFAAAVSTYRKSIATAKTNRKLADLDKDLVQHRGVAEKEAEQAQTDAVNAEADRDAALQALIALNVDPKAIKDIQAGKPVTHAAGAIRSPIAGTLVERLCTPGQLVQAGTTPCFTVADLSRVWVMAQLFGADLNEIAVGDTAGIVTDATTKPVSGTVDNIAALVDPNTRAVAVRIVVDNPGGVLKKQMYVHVRIEARRESSGLLVPVAAVLRDDVNLPFVYVAESDGSFARRSVTLGYRSGDQYDIVDGLKAGESIVADGAIFLQFMQNQ